MAPRQPSGVVRLRDLVDANQKLRVCCGTCGHGQTLAAHQVNAPLDLPLAEVRRMLTCTSCGGRWVDVKRVDAPVVADRVAEVVPLRTWRRRG